MVALDKHAVEEAGLVGEGAGETLGPERPFTVGTRIYTTSRFLLDS